MQQHPVQTPRDWPDIILSAAMLLIVALAVFVLAWLVATIVYMIYNVGSTLLELQIASPVF